MKLSVQSSPVQSSPCSLEVGVERKAAEEE